MPTALTNILYKFRTIAFIAGAPLLHLWRLRLKDRPTQKFEVLPEMQPLPLEGYTDKPFYKTGETITFFLKAESDKNTLQIQQILKPDTYHTIQEFQFGTVNQTTQPNAPEAGCNWQPTLQWQIPATAKPGYYRGALADHAGTEISYLTFLVGPTEPKHKIAVLAPVSTWLAYNPYGGKSLYNNAVDKQNVYLVSAQRPNPALQYKPEGFNIHDMPVEVNIFNWLDEHFGADVYPDFMLEQLPEIFESYQLLVLSYHCEYVSEQMHATLRKLVYEKKKTLLSVGANQIYWRVKWHTNFTQMEGRKDASDFAGTNVPSGLWRHTTEPEAKLLGVEFSDTGMGSYAPYKVTEAGHWLYQHTSVKNGDLFGHSGINQLPICGDETDKVTWLSKQHAEIIAHGLNPTSPEPEAVYQPGNPRFDGSGGGDMVFMPLSEQHAVLSTGSIQSGSGLGTDAVFSAVVTNFIRKYLQGAVSNSN